MIEEETTHKPTFSERERERERDYDVARLMLFSAVHYDAWIIYSQNTILNFLLIHGFNKKKCISRNIKC